MTYLVTYWWVVVPWVVAVLVLGVGLVSAWWD